MACPFLTPVEWLSGRTGCQEVLIITLPWEEGGRIDLLTQRKEFEKNFLGCVKPHIQPYIWHGFIHAETPRISLPSARSHVLSLMVLWCRPCYLSSQCLGPSHWILSFVVTSWSFVLSRKMLAVNSEHSGHCTSSSNIFFFFIMSFCSIVSQLLQICLIPRLWTHYCKFELYAAQIFGKLLESVEMKVKSAHCLMVATMFSESIV